MDTFVYWPRAEAGDEWEVKNFAEVVVPAVRETVTRERGGEAG
jgi:hypothetical protein